VVCVRELMLFLQLLASFSIAACSSDSILALSQSWSSCLVKAALNSVFRDVVSYVKLLSLLLVGSS
jgi:hypothetical protein